MPPPRTRVVGGVMRHGRLERETGFEPATSTLARSHSTTELFPPCQTPKCNERQAYEQPQPSLTCSIRSAGLPCPPHRSPVWRPIMAFVEWNMKGWEIANCNCNWGC